MTQRVDRMHCVVFDIGGTSFRAASYVAAEGRLDNAVRMVTPSHWISSTSTMTNIWQELCSMMEAAACQVLDGSTPDVVAVASRPLCRHGRLLAAPTVWGRMYGGSFPNRGTSFGDLAPSGRPDAERHDCRGLPICHARTAGLLSRHRQLRNRQQGVPWGNADDGTWGTGR